MNVCPSVSPWISSASCRDKGTQNGNSFMISFCDSSFDPVLCFNITVQHHQMVRTGCGLGNKFLPQPMVSRYCDVSSIWYNHNNSAVIPHQAMWCYVVRSSPKSNKTLRVVSGTGGKFLLQVRGGSNSRSRSILKRQDWYCWYRTPVIYYTTDGECLGGGQNDSG